MISYNRSLPQTTMTSQCISALPPDRDMSWYPQIPPVSGSVSAHHHGLGEWNLISSGVIRTQWSTRARTSQWGPFLVLKEYTYVAVEWVHAQYFVLINFSWKLKFCAKANFFLLLLELLRIQHYLVACVLASDKQQWWSVAAKCNAFNGKQK